MTKIVITGSRDWPFQKAHLIWTALKKLSIEIGDGEEFEHGWRPYNITLHHGMCPYGGADLIGASWAAGAGWDVIPHPPIEQRAWAYAKRNQEMIDLQPDHVVACFLEGAKNKGTQMTVDMAIAAGLQDRIIVVRG